jgi:nitrous oxidase accessory protein NosD
MSLLDLIACTDPPLLDSAPYEPFDSVPLSTDTADTGDTATDTVNDDKPMVAECYEYFRSDDSISHVHQYIEVRIVDVVNSEGSGRKSRASIDNAIDYLNEQYGADFTFYLPQDGIQVHSDEAIYNTDLTSAEAENFARDFFVSGAMNFFIVPEYGGEEFGGACVGGCLGDGEGATIFIEKEKSASGWAHEVGHYGGLMHTWGNNLELVDGSNCATAGDFVCETPADADNSGCEVDAETCSVVSCATDANGDGYQPDVNNIMSYYPDACGDHLYQEQLDVVSCVMWTVHADHLRDTPASAIDPAPQTVTVGCDAESLPNIQEGIDAVVENGVVQICPGTYVENVIVDNTQVTFEAPYGDVIIDGNGTGSVVMINDSDVVIQGIALTNGYNDVAGGMEITNSTVALIDMQFYLNSAALFSGALMANSSEIDISNVVFENNQAGQYYGAAYFFDSTVSLNNTIFTRNTAPQAGAMSFNSCDDILIENADFEDNVSDDSLVSVENSSGNFSDVSFSNNQSATLIDFDDASVSISDGNLEDNDIQNATLELMRSTVTWQGGSLINNQTDVEVNLIANSDTSIFECYDVTWNDIAEDNIDVLVLGKTYDLEDGQDYLCSTDTQTCEFF